MDGDLYSNDAINYNYRSIFKYEYNPCVSYGHKSNDKWLIPLDRVTYDSKPQTVIFYSNPIFMEHPVHQLTLINVPD